MTEQLPPPLTPLDADLRAFPFTPIFRSRLFGSSFHARVNDSEWRAGVTLWLKSWDQVPAGSLPQDDIDLCRLAELGRDLRAWKKLRDGALRGWQLCVDGRLYHPVVAEGINEALEGKRKQQEKTLAARIGAMKKRLVDAKTDEARASMTAEIESMSQALLQLQSQKAMPSVTESVTGSVTSTNREGKREGDRQGEGKREGKREGKGQGEGDRQGQGLLPSSMSSSAGAAADGNGRAPGNADPLPPVPAPPGGGDWEYVGELKVVLTDAEHNARFKQAIAKYPDYVGEVSLILVEKACRRIVDSRAGTWDDIEASCDRLAKFVAAKGRSNPKYVHTPLKHFSDPALWRGEWKPPKDKAEQQQDENVGASLEWLRQKEAERAAS